MYAFAAETFVICGTFCRCLHRRESDHHQLTRECDSYGYVNTRPSYAVHRDRTVDDAACPLVSDPLSLSSLSLSLGSFIPILLESLARENGILIKSGKPCGPSNAKLTDTGEQCVVHILGLEVNTASFAMYTFSSSVLLQALLVVSISSAADHGQYRKKLLLGFAWIGSFSVMLYLFVASQLYLLGALLAIISNVAFGASFVLLNSFLPLLVRNHPRILYAEGALTPDLTASNSTSHGESRRLESSHSDDDTDTLPGNTSTTGLLEDEESHHRLTKVLSHKDQTGLEIKLSTEISAKGISIGYAAGLFLQCVAILVLVKMKSSTWSLRVVLFMVGAWWAIFTIPAAFWLRPRPGPPLPAGKNKTGFRALLSYTAFAWKSLWKTIKLARRLVDIVLFLGAWFLLSDAIATTSSTAILFAKTTLHMESWALGLISVISTTAGIGGALSWSWISRRFNLQPHQTLLACISLFELIPIYGLLGYLPFVQAWGVLGLQQPWEMFPLAGIYGFVMGGLMSYCRAVYGELIPPGSEAAFYALYAITDKGSSVFGPFIVASIIDATGEIRPAFWFLAVLVGLPAPLIYFVNVERGKLDAERLADVIEGLRDASHGSVDGDPDVREHMLRPDHDDED